MASMDMPKSWPLAMAPTAGQQKQGLRELQLMQDRQGLVLSQNQPSLLANCEQKKQQ